MKPEKLIEDGEVAILYSPGYGAGWSTLTSEHAEFLIFDRRLVEAARRKASRDEVDELLQTIFGPDVHIYTGGWEKVCIAWFPVKTKLLISEYDGSESIILFNPVDFYEA